MATNSDLELIEYLSRQIFKITENLQRVNINIFFVYNAISAKVQIASTLTKMSLSMINVMTKNQTTSLL